MGDWIITAGILAISLVLLLISLSLDARLRKLEKEIKTMKDVEKLGNMTLPDAKQYADQIEEELIKYNQSYGNPDYTEWIDNDFDKKGVK
jgi:hypothetical protein